MHEEPIELSSPFPFQAGAMFIATLAYSTDHRTLRDGFFRAICRSEVPKRAIQDRDYEINPQLIVTFGRHHTFVHPPLCGLVGSLVGAILCSTASAALAEEPLKIAGTQFEPVKWTQLAGWALDDHLAAFAAYKASCQALRKTGQSGDQRPKANPGRITERLP